MSLLNRIKSGIVLIAVSALLAFNSCTGNGDLDKNGIPTILKIGQSTGEEDPSETFRRMEPLKLYLEETLGVPVEFYRTTGYAPAIEALKSKKIHIAGLSPFAYILAKERTDLEVFTTIGTEAGGPRTYYSVIITKKGSGLDSMEDIIARSKELTLGFSDPASTSGHFIPRAHLHQVGLDPDTDFKNVVFTTSQTATVLSAMTGKTDVVCGSYGVLYYLMNKYNYTFEKDINLIWKSPPIVNQAKCIRTDINPEFRKKVQDAYVNLKRDKPEVWDVIAKRYERYFPGDISQLTYAPANDSLYDGLRELARGLDFTNYMDDKK